MSTLTDLLDFLCPAVSDADDALKQLALTEAAKHVPATLSDNKKESATVYYAGWILGRHKVDDIQSAGIKSKKEGGLSITYTDGGSDGDLYGYFKEYLRICGIKKAKDGSTSAGPVTYGSIMVGNGQA